MKHRKWTISLLGGILLCALPVAVGQEIENPAPRSSVTPHVKHGGKDDIQAIGNRKVGGGGVGNWYSLEREIKIGQEYSQAIEGTVDQILDPVITEYVNRIGQNLVRNSDAKVPFAIKVVDSEEVNAFALPGGFLYVNSGLILAAQDEAELAAVMAHEIAHVAARHATRQMTRSEMFNLASIPLILVGGGLGVALQQAAGLAIPLSVTKFSRSFEAEADYLGVEYLYKAGYDPQAVIAFFERVQAMEKQKPGLISKAFANHPQTADRIKKTQKEIATILPSREAYVISTSEFDDVKTRLRVLEDRRETSGQDESRPVLRRKPAADGDSDEGSDRPTLKRRNN